MYQLPKTEIKMKISSFCSIVIQWNFPQPKKKQSNVEASWLVVCFFFSSKFDDLLEIHKFSFDENLFWNKRLSELSKWNLNKRPNELPVPSFP